ncbi:MAG TPA: hypothetical protein VFB14_28480 [Bryobacteraceae bacterium]|nr:hypothetical protein [Bryobacteraceae bacterium]
MKGTIVALAGRRIDAPGASSPRFPAANTNQILKRIREALSAQQASMLISSAACGADLLGLQAATQLGIKRRVVLPFPREKFRSTSVADRPGDWGAQYDRILDDVERAGDLVVLGYRDGDSSAYTATNEAILNEAGGVAAASGQRIIALVVWDGQSRGPDDITEHFLNEAAQRGLHIHQVSTLCPPAAHASVPQ